VLENKFIFSFTRNLTQRLRFFGVSPNQHHINASYCWNKPLAKSLIESGVSDWHIPVIQGMVYKMSYHVGNTSFDLYYFTKRSAHRGGFKPKISGVNNLGFTADFVKHEIHIDSKLIEINFQFSTGNIPFQVFKDKSHDTSYHLRKSEIKNHMAFHTHLRLLCKPARAERQGNLDFIAITQKNSENSLLNNLLDKEIKTLPEDIEVNVRKISMEDSLEKVRSYQDMVANPDMPTAMWRDLMKSSGFSRYALMHPDCHKPTGLRVSLKLHYRVESSKKHKKELIEIQRRVPHASVFGNGTSHGLNRLILWICYGAICEGTYAVGEKVRKGLDKYERPEISSFDWVQLAQFVQDITWDMKCMYNPYCQKLDKLLKKPTLEDLFPDLPESGTDCFSYNFKCGNYTKILGLQTEYDGEEELDIVNKIGHSTANQKFPVNIKIVNFNVSGFRPNPDDAAKILQKFLFPAQEPQLCTETVLNHESMPLDEQPCDSFGKKRISGEESFLQAHRSFKPCGYREYSCAPDGSILDMSIHGANNLESMGGPPEIFVIGLQEVIE
jgi:hypothetical protein